MAAWTTGPSYRRADALTVDDVLAADDWARRQAAELRDHR